MYVFYNCKLLKYLSDAGENSPLVQDNEKGGTQTIIMENDQID